MGLGDHKASFVRALMLLQSVVALAGLAAKIILVVNGHTADQETVILPPLSIFVLASGLLPAILSFTVARQTRWGRNAVIGVEVTVAAYSLLASLNRLNLSLAVNLAIAILVIILLLSLQKRGFTGLES
ncbi:hypothetical protein AB0G05_41945 [Nonomuraea wenchangensis]